MVIKAKKVHSLPIQRFPNMFEISVYIVYVHECLRFMVHVYVFFLYLGNSREIMLLVSYSIIIMQCSQASVCVSYSIDSVAMRIC